MLLEVLPPLDWDKVGTETWGDVVRQVRQIGTKRVFINLTSRDKRRAGRDLGRGFSAGAPA